MINERYLSSVQIIKIAAGIAVLAVLTTTIAMDPAFATETQPAGKVNPNTPKLVLQITVDALRGDLPTRHPDHLVCP